MDAIELKERGKGGEEDEKFEDARERQEEEETSFTERSEETKDDYDDIRSRIDSDPADQGETSKGYEYEDDQESAYLEKQLQNIRDRKETRREEAIKALEAGTGVRFNVEYGDKTKTLIDFISDIRFRKRDGVLIALKYKGEKVFLTKEGKIDKRSINKNRKIWEAIVAANEEYEKTFDSVADESAGFSLSDEARESVQENVADRLSDITQERYDEIEEKDIDENILREIKGITHVDDTVDYDNLNDPDQKNQLFYKIASLQKNIKYFEDLEEKEHDPIKKLLYETSKDFCVAKKSYLEVRAGIKPTSEIAISLIQEEVERNDLTRFERFKKWVKENLVGVSAVAISVAGIITATIMAGRNAVKKRAKAVGQFGKALANLAKKAGPAIATILNVLAQVLTWGAKALEFLSRNLWIVALFLTYLVYDTVKGRMKSKN